MKDATIHRAIRRCRLEAGISQSELGRRAGLPVRNISYWEAGHGDPPFSAFARIARGLGMPIEELVRGCAPEDEVKA